MKSSVGMRMSSKFDPNQISIRSSLVPGFFNGYWKRSVIVKSIPKTESIRRSRESERNEFVAGSYSISVAGRGGRVWLCGGTGRGRPVLGRQKGASGPRSKHPASLPRFRIGRRSLRGRQRCSTSPRFGRWPLLREQQSAPSVILRNCVFKARQVFALFKERLLDIDNHCKWIMQEIGSHEMLSQKFAKISTEGSNFVRCFLLVFLRTQLR